MAEPLSLTASVVGVVSFGMRLATALQTYTELASEANEALHDIVFDINATASALKQLSELIEADKLAASKQGRLPIFKDAGETEIRNIATQLEKVYKAIVVLVKKATSFKTEASSSQNSSSDGMVIDPSQLKPLNFFRKAKWPWMVPRVERYQAQLHWLKFSLLINLQLADLAQINMSTGPRADGAFDQELAARGAAEKLRGRQVALGRKMAVKQKKKKRARPGNTTRGIEPVIRVDAENVSISSSDDASPGPSPTLKPASHSPQAHSTSAVTTKPEVSGTFVQVTPKEQNANEQRGTSPAGEQQEEKSTTNNNTNTNVETPKPNQEPPPQDTPDEDPSVETPPPTNRKTPTRFLLPSFLHSFTFPIFGATDKYLSDTPSEDLEAYIISSDSPSTPTKLPFGHRRLTFGLKRTLKAKRGSTWYRYVTNSTPTQRHLIDQVTKYAQGQSNHMRTCVSIQEFKPDGKLPYYLVFYSLCEPPPPLYFTDCIDRHYRLPFEQYKIWEVSRGFLAFPHSHPHPGLMSNDPTEHESPHRNLLLRSHCPQHPRRKRPLPSLHSGRRDRHPKVMG